MDGVNKTLYIPLYGKSYVSKIGIILDDKTAEEIWEKEGFSLRGKSASKWLAYYMGMRARVFDDWTSRMIDENPDAVVLHLGCGLDSRVKRVGKGRFWYDVDFPEVIEERRKYFSDSENYTMLSADLSKEDSLDSISENKCAIVVMEGISMYLTPDELKGLFISLKRRFEKVHLLMDSYTTLAARMSKIKNPINDVGVTTVYGMDDPTILSCSGIGFVCERDMTPTELIDELPKKERGLFSFLYAGNTARKMYKMFEYEK